VIRITRVISHLAVHQIQVQIVWISGRNFAQNLLKRLAKDALHTVKVCGFKNELMTRQIIARTDRFHYYLYGLTASNLHVTTFENIAIIVQQG
jgi:hypothetical protein